MDHGKALIKRTSNCDCNGGNCVRLVDHAGIDDQELALDAYGWYLLYNQSEFLGQNIDLEV